MNKVFRFSCISFLLSLVPTGIWAQAPPVEGSDNSSNAVASPTPSLGTPTQLSEVVVTANRLDTPASQVTDSMTVITAEETVQKQAGTVLDVLRGVPGLEVAQAGQPGQLASIFLRGANPEHTLVLLDGVPLNDPTGTSFTYDYLDGLSLDDIERIEVVRGPQSTLWGSNAIGGVINLIPRGGPGPLGGSVMVEGGSYGTSGEAVAAQGGDNGGYFSFNASHYNTAGFPALNVKGLDATDAALEAPGAGSVNNGDDNNTLSLRMGSNLTVNLEEKVFVRYSQSNTGLDTFNSSFVLGDDPSDFALQKQFLADSRTDWKLLGGSWEQRLDLSFSDDDRLYTATANPYNTYYANGSYDGQTLQALWQNNIHLAKEETVVVGIQGQEQWAFAAYTSGYTDLGPYAPDDLPVTSVRVGTGFAESQTSVEDRLFFNLGGRWEDHSQFGVHTTYQAGLAYFLPGTDTKVSANYGTGFLAPSLYQLYDPAYGNLNLQPETSLGYDFGLEQPFGGKGFLDVGADYFDNDLSNLIEYGPAPYFIPENIGRARTYGVEAFVTFKGIPDLAVKGSYTYTYAWDLTDNTALIRRPQNVASADVEYRLGKAGFGASLLYVGDNLDDDFGNGPNGAVVVTLPGYVIVDLRASYELDPRVKFFARVDNLFNQWYEELYGYSTPGLSAYGGTKVSF